MRRIPGVLWIASGAVLWGTDSVLRRPLTDKLGPTQIVLCEHVILALVVVPILFSFRSYLPKISGTTWAALLATAWFGSALATVLFTAAIRSGDPTTAILLQKTQPVFAIVLARCLLRERLPKAFAALATVAVIGGYLIAFGAGNLLAPLSSLQLWPALLAIGAAVGWGGATVWGRIATDTVPFQLVTSLRIVLALPALLVLAALQQQLGLPGQAEIPSLLWIALVPGFTALMLYYRGLRSTPASQATIAELAFPATASLLNWFAFGTAPGFVQIAGFVLLWTAIFRLPG